MRRSFLLAVLLFATAALAQYVPPVLKGVQGEGKARQVQGPIPFPPADQTWQRVGAKPSIFVSAAGERPPGKVEEAGEAPAAARARLNPRCRGTRGTQIYVSVFATRGHVQPYFDMLVNRHDAHVTA